MGTYFLEIEGLLAQHWPDDFATKVKQINSQSDLIWMSSFAGPSYLTIRSSVYIILIWDLYTSNLYNLWQTRCIYIHRKPHQCGLHFNEQITRTHFLLLQPSIRPVPAQAILLWKGPPKLCIECHLVPLWVFPPKSPGRLMPTSVTKKALKKQQLLKYAPLTRNAIIRNCSLPNDMMHTLISEINPAWNFKFSFF